MTLRLHPGRWNNENTVIEGMITEAIRIYSQDLYYIPRSLVAKNDILGEDRLSEFKTAYPIPMYMENSDNGFEGQGAFVSKFGLQMEQMATLTVAKREWNKLVGKYGNTVLPNRPAEGDLIYYPLTKGLFEINFVQHANPFYQVGQLYVYQLTVELFRYASEKIATDIPDIDVFESLKTHSTTSVVNGQTVNNSADTPNSFGDSDKFDTAAVGKVFDTNNPFGNN